LPAYMESKAPAVSDHASKTVEHQSRMSRKAAKVVKEGGNATFKTMGTADGRR